LLISLAYTKPKINETKATKVGLALALLKLNLSQHLFNCIFVFL